MSPLQRLALPTLAAALLATTPRPTEEQIREEVTNICRCGTYNRVIAGIQRAAGTGTAG
jgi:isoquinoline 1-oxidoreductase alpha subunit